MNFFFNLKINFKKKPLKTKGLIDKENNVVNIFIYEKTYLFISLEPLCNLIEKIYTSILGVKKLNFLFNLTDFSSLFVKENFEHFVTENNEKVKLNLFFFIFRINLTLDR